MNLREKHPFLILTEKQPFVIIGEKQPFVFLTKKLTCTTVRMPQAAYPFSICQSCQG